MHSSTSNSSARVPRGSWFVTWCIVLLAVALFVAGWEFFVRERGISDAAVANSEELWVRERARASQLGDDAIILVGASRMQLGIDLQVMKRLTSRDPVQLAISDSPFLPVLEHLARDPSVTGTIVVSLTASDLTLSTSDTLSALWSTAYDTRKDGKTRVYYQPVEDALHSLVDAGLVSFERDARPQDFFFGTRDNVYVRTLPDRSQQADYSKVDRELAYQRRVEQVLGRAPVDLRQIPDFADHVQHLESLAQRITERGGEVVFVRMPSTKKIREIEDARYPREVYWDAIAASLSARSVHFEDHPELAQFDFPDGVHLDVSDQAAFTEALVRVLMLLPRR